MKINEICEQFKALEIKEIAINPFISISTGKHDMTAFFYYPNLKKMSIYFLSHETCKTLDTNNEYFLKIVYHLPVMASDIEESK